MRPPLHFMETKNETWVSDRTPQTTDCRSLYRVRVERKSDDELMANAYGRTPSDAKMRAEEIALVPKLIAAALELIEDSRLTPSAKLKQHAEKFGKILDLRP